ncbi:hypothetical protein SARC_09536 [Sphaeroforma arctica JP610]|uniref:Uncharacterized protein n=1 Tax=Sphaeroforma arctica JP610 TaxID=667725 RepID=A0A0L0FMN4_9EUKA|nr:hypothetical protein SARC_09536 [Sphaeroforma arctica JP610]KNC78015.1 hypothetical protein SARC_09536 [Sphaeroforma arctica JP610]|eukprot:XP_014151917.1 hypothetical protein SARC_09536 [Sphaeroforma arctica JP610]
MYSDSNAPGLHHSMSQQSVSNQPMGSQHSYNQPISADQIGSPKGGVLYLTTPQASLVMSTHSEVSEHPDDLCDGPTGLKAGLSNTYKTHSRSNSGTNSINSQSDVYGGLASPQHISCHSNSNARHSNSSAHHDSGSAHHDSGSSSRQVSSACGVARAPGLCF